MTEDEIASLLEIRLAECSWAVPSFPSSFQAMSMLCTMLNNPEELALCVRTDPALPDSFYCCLIKSENGRFLLPALPTDEKENQADT